MKLFSCYKKFKKYVVFRKNYDFLHFVFSEKVAEEDVLFSSNFISRSRHYNNNCCSFFKKIENDIIIDHTDIIVAIVYIHSL